MQYVLYAHDFILDAYGTHLMYRPMRRTYQPNAASTAFWFWLGPRHYGPMTRQVSADFSFWLGAGD